METDIAGGNALAAAELATADPSFYNVVLKNFVMPWTNRNQTVFAPLNDYTATVIGMVRDDVAFNTVLSADILYKSNASGLPPVSAANNNHYATAEQNGVDLKATLVPTTPVCGLWAADGGDRRCDDDARRLLGLLQSTAPTERCFASRSSIICVPT